MTKKSVSLTKTEETVSSKNKATAKKIGANMVVTIGGEKFSRKVSMEDGEKIFKEIEMYNKRPSDSRKSKIIELATPEATKKKQEKEKQQAKIKGLKQQVKKEVKKSKSNSDKEGKNLMQQLEELLSNDEEAVNKLQELINKFKKKEEKAPVAQTTSNPRHGEY